MALARRSRGDTGMNYWPGFVDALSTLILSVVFLLSVFVVVQFFLAQEVSGRDTALQRLNAADRPAHQPAFAGKVGRRRP